MIRYINLSGVPYLFQAEYKFVAKLPDKYSLVEHVGQGVVNFVLPDGRSADLKWVPLPEFHRMSVYQTIERYSPSLFTSGDVQAAKIWTIAKALGVLEDDAKRMLESQAQDLGLSFSELLDKQYQTAKPL